VAGSLTFEKGDHWGDPNMASEVLECRKAAFKVMNAGICW